MRKISVYALTLGVVLILVGLVWSGFSLHRISGDVRNIDTSNKSYESKHVTFDSRAITNIHVNVKNIKVQVIATRDNTHIKVAYFKTGQYKFNVTASSTTISVASTQTPSGFDDGNGFCLFRCISSSNNSKMQITIYVPTDSVYDYNITSQNSGVIFNNNLHTKAIRIVSSNSNVALHTINTIGTISLQSNNGSILTQNVTATGQITLTSSNANNTLDHVRAPSITSKTDNGSAKLVAVTTRHLAVNSSNGQIILDRLVANSSTFVSDNGGVSGTIVGSENNYNCTIVTSNGNVAVDGTNHGSAYLSNHDNTTNHLSIQSSNASVSVTFVKSAD